MDRAWTKGIWMPAVRWDEVTEEGFRGGPVMPDSYNGSQESIEELKQNIGRSGIVGDLVASDFKSSVIFCPLLETDPSTGKPLDYGQFSKGLEKIREKHTLIKNIEQNGRAKTERKNQYSHHRFCEARRRTDGRLDAGDDLFCRCGRDRCDLHLPLHPVRTQHGAC